MEVLNYDFIIPDKKPKNHPFLPSNIRCLIIGPANCGKTNLLFNFICNEGWLDYDRLYVYSRTLCQPKYKVLQSVFAKIEDEVGRRLAYFHDTQNDLIPPEDLDPQFRNLIIFDDCLLDKQNNIERYFAQGRHSNADVFYCSQSYTRIPKQVIRDNANLLILFPIDDLNLKHVYENHVDSDMDFADFKTLCRTCWDKPHSFLAINKTLNEGRYTRSFLPPPKK